MVKYLVIFILLAIVTTAHINFVIRVPAIAPLYMKMDETATFSGGELTLSNGVYILSNP